MVPYQNVNQQTPAIHLVCPIVLNLMHYTTLSIMISQNTSCKKTIKKNISSFQMEENIHL